MHKMPSMKLFFFLFFFFHACVYTKYTVVVMVVVVIVEGMWEKYGLTDCTYPTKSHWVQNRSRCRTQLMLCCLWLFFLSFSLAFRRFRLIRLLFNSFLFLLYYEVLCAISSYRGLKMQAHTRAFIQFIQKIPNLIFSF